MGVIDPRTNRVTAEIPLGFKSSLVAAGEGHIWVVDSRGATLRKIDPRTREVQTIPLAAGAGDVPFGIAVGGGAVWVAVLRGTHQVVLELGPDLGEPRREIPFGEGGAPLFGLHPLAVGDRALWAIDRSVGGIWRIDFAERKARKLTEGLDALAIAVAGDAVWVAGQATVTKIDAATGFTLGSMPVDTATAETSSIAVGRDEASIWFASSAGDSLARIDERSVGTTRTFPVGAGPSDVAVGEGAVWVANSRDGTISRVDPKTGTSTSIKLGQAPGGVVAAYGAVWTTPGEPRS
jgi:DNA-binding beta-propeller fold protein YncE